MIRSFIHLIVIWNFMWTSILALIYLKGWIFDVVCVLELHNLRSLLLEVWFLHYALHILDCLGATLLFDETIRSIRNLFTTYISKLNLLDRKSYLVCFELVTQSLFTSKLNQLIQEWGCVSFLIIIVPFLCLMLVIWCLIPESRCKMKIVAAIKRVFVFSVFHGKIYKFIVPNALDDFQTSWAKK